MEMWIGIGVAALIVIMLVVIYNKMVVARNTYKNALSQIDVSLKQRHDLIPTLVEVVKGYVSHERDTLESIVSARNEAIQVRESLGEMPNSEQMTALATSEKNLNDGVMKIFALSEAYPDLKASENFRDLQDQISRLEDKISSARRGYNLTVLEYNNTIETVPNNFVAGIFKFKRAQELDFSDEPEIKSMPKVEF